MTRSFGHLMAASRPVAARSASASATPAVSVTEEAAETETTTAGDILPIPAVDRRPRDRPAAGRPRRTGRRRAARTSVGPFARGRASWKSAATTVPCARAGGRRPLGHVVGRARRRRTRRPASAKPHEPVCASAARAPHGKSRRQSRPPRTRQSASLHRLAHRTPPSPCSVSGSSSTGRRAPAAAPARPRRPWPARATRSSRWPASRRGSPSRARCRPASSAASPARRRGRPAASGCAPAGG